MPGILRIATGVGLATVLYKSLAATQQLLIARVLGATSSADAFFLAQVIPVLIGGLLFNALSTSTLFVLNGRKERGVVAGIFLIAAMVLSVMAALVFFSGGFLIRLIAPAMSQSLLQEALTVQSMLLPVLLFQPLAGVLSGALLSEGRLLTPPLSICLMYISGLAGLAVTKDGSSRSLALGLSIGSVLQVLVLLAGSGRRWIVKPVVEMSSLGQLAGQAFPALGCNAISTWFLIADRSFAASFGVGQLAAISYVYSLITMPTQIIVNTVVGVCMPRWVSANQDRAAFGEGLTKALSLLFCAVMPVTILVAIGARPLTELALGVTRFTPEAIASTATLLAAYSPAIMAFAAKDALTAAALSQGKASIAFVIGIGGVLLAILLKSFLSPDLGIKTAAVGTSVGVGLCAALLLAHLLDFETVRNCWAYSREAVMAAVPALVAGVAAGRLTPDGLSWAAPCIALICYAGAWISFGGIASGLRLVRGRW
jgi:putative peptidoglycan lipid II flippase